MKRFVVLVEFQNPENKDEMAQEPVRDFDTFDEAVDFISQQYNPNSYIIDDIEADDLDEEETLMGSTGFEFVDGPCPDGSLVETLRDDLNQKYDSPDWMSTISDRDTGDEVLYPEDYLDEDMTDDEYYDSIGEGKGLYH